VTLMIGMMMLKIQLYHHSNKLHFIIYYNLNKKMYCNAYCIFGQINGALVNIKDFFQKHKSH